MYWTSPVQGFPNLLLKAHFPACFPTTPALPAADYLHQVGSVSLEVGRHQHTPPSSEMVSETVSQHKHSFILKYTGIIKTEAKSASESVGVNDKDP